MAFILPPPKVSGSWEIKEPFKIPKDVVFTLIAIREFKDLLDQRTDVYLRYYSPFGIPRETYEQDLKGGACLLTLDSASNGTFYIPNSYVINYPRSSALTFRRVILSVDLGLVPQEDSLLDNVTSKVSGVVEESFGRKPTVEVHSVPYDDVVTPEYAASLENARVAGITDPQSDFARYRASQEENLRLTQRIAELEKIIIALQP